MRLFWLWTAMIVVAVLAVGCDNGGLDATVSGTVTVDGKPAPLGEVTFYPMNDDLKSATPRGTIEPNGNYSLKVGSKSGLPSGEYRVSVAVMEMRGGGPNVAPAALSLSPPRYGDPKTSGLTFTVKPGSNTIDLRLSSP